MEDDFKELDLIDRFLRKELSGDELKGFEEKVRSDKALKERILEQKNFSNLLNGFGTRELFKKQLDQFHMEMPRQEFKKIEETKKILIHWPTVAVAASVALVALFVSIYSWNWIQVTEDEERSHYTELRRDLENMQKSQQRTDVKNISTVAATSEVLPAGGGTGFVISSKGLLLTSAHIVQNADSILLENEDYTLKATKVFEDKKLDIALLKVNEPKFEEFPVLPYFLKKGIADLGSEIFTLGFPRNEVVYGEGYISSVSGYNADTLAYQISLALNPGNSGSPVFDDQGSIVGIISGKNRKSEGAGFAIKTSNFYTLLDTLMIQGQQGKVNLTRYGNVRGWKRSEQIKKIKPFIFDVKVFKAR